MRPYVVGLIFVVHPILISIVGDVLRTDFFVHYALNTIFTLPIGILTLAFFHLVDSGRILSSTYANATRNAFADMVGFFIFISALSLFLHL